MSQTDGLEDLADAEPPAWPAATWDMPLRVALKLPDDSRIERLQLREPTCQEWEEIQAHPTPTRRRYAVSRIAGVPMNAMANMGIGDVVRAEEYIASFFGVGLSIRGW